MRNIIFAICCFLPAGAYAQDAAREPAQDLAQEPAQEPARVRAVSVQSSALQDVGPWGAAALPDGLAPLPSDLWRNSDPATLGLLLTRISPDQRFYSLQSLTRRAIFSGGAAPTTDPDVTRARFEAANRFGPAQATARLVFGVPRLASQNDLAAIAIDSGLRTGRIDEACGLIEAVSAPPQGTIWLEARAACYALNDEAAAANLSVDLAKSRGLTDAWLSRAIAAVAGPLTAPPPFRVDSGRATALSLKAKLKPPLTLAANQDPMVLSALIENGDFLASLESQERLTLVRNGASRGVVSLGVLASHQPAPEPVLDPALPVPAVPAQITQKMLAAPTLLLRIVEARLAIGDIKTVMATQPGLMTLADVPVLAEAALWSGEGALANSIASLSPVPLDPRLMMVAALYDPSQQASSVEARIAFAGADPIARRVAMRDVVIAWAAGVTPESGLSLLVQSGLPSGPSGNVGLRAALDLAGARGAKGEVILLTALALQGVESSTSDPETLIGAIKALRRVGLPEAARDLARDYLLAGLVSLPARSPSRLQAPTRPASTRPTSAGPTSAGPVAPRPAAPKPASIRPAPTVPTAPALRPSNEPTATVRPPPRPVVRPPASLVPRAAPQTSPTPRPSVKPSWGTP